MDNNLQQRSTRLNGTPHPRGTCYINYYNDESCASVGYMCVSVCIGENKTEEEGGRKSKSDWQRERLVFRDNLADDPSLCCASSVTVATLSCCVCTFLG